jgi:hypothetical protein
MNLTRPLNRLFLLPVFCALAAFALVPTVRAIPPDQIKDAGAIKLTTDLLDKMDGFIQAVSADTAAKAELTEIGKDPKVSQDENAWAAAITSKCPKTTEHLKKAGLTASDFTKGVSAIMACAMSEDMVKSDNEAAKANAEFVAANRARAEKTLGTFMQMSMGTEPSSPASTP